MTTVAIIGAHGKVGQQLMRLLYDEGDDFIGVVRGEEHPEDVYRLGGQGVLLDLETASAAELADAVAGADALVFTAGAGGGGGVARKRTVDYGAAVLSIEAAGLAGIRRFVQISAVGVDDSATADAIPDPQWAAYVAAKRDADAALRASGLDWTILRPAQLTMEEPTGLVTLAERVERSAAIPRGDVAAAVVAVLANPRSIGRQWELASGNTPVADAVDRLTR